MQILTSSSSFHLCPTKKPLDNRINEEDICTALKGVYDQCRGGYACVAMIAGIFKSYHK